MTHMQPFDPATRPPVSQGENTLGVAGFVCSLVGILSCGLLAPVGLVLSLFALKKEPKGLAIAGVIIGGVGSCGFLVGVLVFFSWIMVVLAALGMGGLAVALGGAKIEAQFEMSQIAKEIDVYQQRTGNLPAALDLLPITDPETLTDHWGNKYAYKLGEDGKTYTLFSFGPDGTEGTPDDIARDTDWNFSSSSATPPANAPDV